MTDYTPDSLRALAGQGPELDRAGIRPMTQHERAIVAHADAWKAERICKGKEHDELVDELGDAIIEANVLRKRLGRYQVAFEAHYVADVCPDCDELAALEEKPVEVEQDVMLADTPLSTQKVSVTFRLAGEETP